MAHVLGGTYVPPIISRFKSCSNFSNFFALHEWFNDEAMGHFVMASTSFLFQLLRHSSSTYGASLLSSAFLPHRLSTESDSIAILKVFGRICSNFVLRTDLGHFRDNCCLETSKVVDRVRILISQGFDPA